MFARRRAGLERKREPASHNCAIINSYNSSNDIQKALAQGIQINMAQNDYNQPNLYNKNLN